MIALSEVHVLDDNAIAAGLGLDQLIEAAADGLVEIVQARWPDGPIVVVAGRGHNGADALVAAAKLRAAGRDVRAHAPSADWTRTAAASAAASLGNALTIAAHNSADAAAGTAALPPAFVRDLDAATVVVDGLLGAGIGRPLAGAWLAWAQAIAHAGKPILAVDVPSGFPFDTPIKPAVTASFHAKKEGLTAANAGDIIVVDIGITDAIARSTGPGEYRLYPQGRADQHKGEGGIVLVIGGGPYTGAPAVSGLAALRSGADLAIILTPHRAWDTIASYSPNLIVRPLLGDDLDFDEPANRVTLNTWLKKATSVVLGPGAGLMSPAQKAVQHVMERAAREELPVVVDADALTALSQRTDLLGDRHVVTPHAREFANLSGRQLPDEPVARLQVAEEVAKSLGATWLVKGPTDIITNGARSKLNPGGHPAMSVGGTGDVLAGCVGALLAKGLEPFDAARVAARLVKDAGAAAAAEMSWGLVATDVVDRLAPTLTRALVGANPAGVPGSAVLKHDIQ